MEKLFIPSVGHGHKGGTFTSGGRLHLGWFGFMAKAHRAVVDLSLCPVVSSSTEAGCSSSCADSAMERPDLNCIVASSKVRQGFLTK